MAEHKLFDTPRFHDADFYRNIEVADHWTQPGHGERLRMTFVRVAEVLLEHPEVHTVADWGCGNGRLLFEIMRMFPRAHAWGYDLLPANVAFAKSELGFDTAVMYKDFVNETDARAGNLTILTEVLEHLIDPHGMLKRLLVDPACQWIVASSPYLETPESFYPLHNWIWTDDSYQKMFRDAGWVVVSRTDFTGAQITVARKP